MTDIAHTDALPTKPGGKLDLVHGGELEKPVSFMGLPILRRTSEQMVQLIEQHVGADRPLDIAFCNANTLLQAHDDQAYRQTLASMTLLNDGIGADIAARILDGQPFAENLNGTDFVPYLLKHTTKPLRVYMLGAKPEVVSKAAEKWAKQFPRHNFCGHQHGYFDRKAIGDVLDNVNAAKPDLLLVAMGNPAQENFIMEHRGQLDVPVTMGVGALFDFTAQIVPRAPIWMRKVKIEWLFRLSREPRRLVHRYTVGIGRFLYVCLKLRLANGRAGSFQEGAK
ncbi:MAG: WecB/TagA/CpsF family glycosyltransferase [Pseudomonadota bacterium]